MRPCQAGLSKGRMQSQSQKIAQQWPLDLIKAKFLITCVPPHCDACFSSNPEGSKAYAWAYFKIESSTSQRDYFWSYLQDGLLRWSSFTHCDKIVEIFNLKGKTHLFYFVIFFWSFHTKLLGPIAMRPVDSLMGYGKVLDVAMKR